MISKYDALRIVKNRSGWVHCFENSEKGVLSCNYTMDHFKSVLQDSKTIEVGGENYRSSNHVLCIDKKLFFEAIEEFEKVLNTKKAFDYCTGLPLE